MNTNEVDKAYVSPYDKFLFAFDAQHAKSLSQLQEIRKHQAIAFMRDNKISQEGKTMIWEEF